MYMHGVYFFVCVLVGVCVFLFICFFLSKNFCVKPGADGQESVSLNPWELWSLNAGALSQACWWEQELVPSQVCVWCEPLPFSLGLWSLIPLCPAPHWSKAHSGQTFSHWAKMITGAAPLLRSANPQIGLVVSDAGKPHIIVKGIVLKIHAWRGLVPLCCCCSYLGHVQLLSGDKIWGCLMSLLMSGLAGHHSCFRAIGAGAVTAHQYSHCCVCLGSNCLQCKPLCLN